VLTSGEYGPGDLVAVTIRRRVLRLEHSGVLAVETALNGTLLRLDAEDVTVELVAPAEPEVPEWWDRRDRGMVVLTPKRGAWLHRGSGFPLAPWVGETGAVMNDSQVLDLEPLLLHDPAAPAEPLHTWPPKEPGLWYRENGRRRDCWYSVAVTSPGVAAIGLRCTELNGVYTAAEAEKIAGRMTPIPALSGDWPGLGAGLGGVPC